MAGIGFELRKLAGLDSISSVAAAAGHAAIIAAGPWLFTIFSLAAITMLTQQAIGFEALSTFRTIVIYAFAISLVATAPVTIVATRLVSDTLWTKKPERVRELLFAAYILALASTVLGLALVIVLLRPDPKLAVVLSAMTASVALIWVTLAFCGAIRDYAGVTRAFFVGLLIALVATIAAAALGAGPYGMAVGFLAGLNVVQVGLSARVLATFPTVVSRVDNGLRSLTGGLLRYWHLAAGALAGTMGVWVDKWIFWISSEGEIVGGGLLHSPLYDSAMFISSLAIIPSLAAFVLRLETDFFDRYQQYYATIRSHGTLDQIEDARANLAGHSMDNLTLVTVAQAGICGVLALAAPAIVAELGLQFRQVAILRYGAIGVVFQFVLIACSSMLLFFDRRPLYLGVQVLFLTLVAGMTIVTLELGENYYGIGYFLACLVSGFVAYRIADRTFDNLNFLTFLGNNPAIVESAQTRKVTLVERMLARGNRRNAMAGSAKAIGLQPPGAAGR